MSFQKKSVISRLPLNSNNYNFTLRKKVDTFTKQVNEEVKDNQERWDYIIIGAGATGIITAEQIYEKNPKSSILIIEYDDVIGGCVRSYEREYTTTDGSNSEFRRAIEYGGMRYFKDVMPNIHNYVEKYKKTETTSGVTHLTTSVTSGDNILFQNGNRALIKNIDTSYFDDVSLKSSNFIKDYTKDTLDLTTTGEELILDLINNRQTIFRDSLLCQRNISAMTIPNQINTTEWLKFILNGGYQGFFDSEMASTMSIYEIIDLGISQQDVIKEGYQGLLKIILEKKHAIYINDIINPTSGIHILLNTNAIYTDKNKNKIVTSSGNTYGKQFIYTIPPRYMSKLMKTNISNKYNDELINGFVDYKAAKIVLYYNEPWWDYTLIGRNLSDTNVGQLWVIDDVTLMIYCCMDSAVYWMDILNFDMNSDNGKYIVENKVIEDDGLPEWMTSKVLPSIYEILFEGTIDDTTKTKSENLVSYGYALWYDNVPFWRSRSFSKYGSITDRRNLLRFPFGSNRKDHIYVTNALSMRQGWVEGSIEEAYEGIKLLKL
jgi:hypothetical protein